MTVPEITDTINEFDYRLIEEKTEEKEKHRKRRKNTIKKKIKLMQTINDGIAMPSAGFINHDEQNPQRSECYIKLPKNSNTQHWIKQLTSKMSRKYEDMPLKGNKYRRLFDYYWTLY